MKPYLYIGALDLSPYIVRVDSPQISLRGLSLELERDIFFSCFGNSESYGKLAYFRITGGIAIASTIRRGLIQRVSYEGNGKIELYLDSLSTLFLRNLDNEWWHPRDQLRKPWRVSKQNTLFSSNW